MLHKSGRIGSPKGHEGGRDNGATCDCRKCGREHGGEVAGQERAVGCQELGDAGQGGGGIPRGLPQCADARIYSSANYELAEDGGAMSTSEAGNRGSAGAIPAAVETAPAQEMHLSRAGQSLSGKLARAPRSSPSRPKAVLFDLFNTLVPGGTRAQRDEVSRRMAEVLGVEPTPLADLIRRTFDDRTRGRLGDLSETVSWLAGQLGAEPGNEAIDAAVELRLAMTRQLHDDTWALDALTELGHAGFRLGLVSDCSAETPTIWPASPLSAHFEALSFSCLTGHRKPEPEAYLTAVRQLGVRPEECMFVGDGGSFELTGARELGIEAYRFVGKSDDLGESIDEDDGWAGVTITDLHDLLRFAIAR